MSPPQQPPEGASATSPRHTDPRVHLLDGAAADPYRDALTTAVETVAARVTRTDRPFTGASADDLAAAVDAVDLDQPVGHTGAALAELDDLYLRDAVWFHHPRYLAHLNCPVVIPAVVGEAVTAVVNSSLDTWDQSVGATHIEQRLIAWVTKLLGFGEAADGVFTSGGTQSNLHALFLAREVACEGVRAREGHAHRTADILPRLRVLASDCAHFSVAKSAALLGLGWDAVVPVRCGPDRRMRARDLARELRRCRSEGLVPMAVVATAGTTDFGSIDPIARVADVCAAARVWLHVDAAYGCGLLVSRRRRLLTGIERADSATVDFHKSFFQPVPASAVLVRDRGAMRHATYHADYLNPDGDAADATPNQVDKSLQTTRRFDALKLWLTLRIMGADAIGALFDDVVDLTTQAERRVRDDPRFELVAPAQLSTLVFRYVPHEPVGPQLCDEANLHARRELAASGEALVGGTVADGRHQLKLTLLNPNTSLADLGEVLDRIAAHARHYVDTRAQRHADAPGDAEFAGRQAS